MVAQSNENKENLNAEIPSVAAEEKVKQKAEDINKNLLGNLLTFLRKNKLMTLLILCRQITKIEICDQVAEIYAENDILDELESEKNKIQMESYFKNIGLGIKLAKTQVDDNKLNELKFMLGNKLKIKN